jgi:hypothetical protein
LFARKRLDWLSPLVRPNTTLGTEAFLATCNKALLGKVRNVRRQDWKHLTYVSIAAGHLRTFLPSADYWLKDPAHAVME